MYKHKYARYDYSISLGGLDIFSHECMSSAMPNSLYYKAATDKHLVLCQEKLELLHALAYSFRVRSSGCDLRDTTEVSQTNKLLLINNIVNNLG